MGSVLMSRMFPKYKLGKSEAEWVRHFENMTGYAPSGSEDVTCAVSFVDFMDRNIETYHSACMEIKASIERKMLDIPNYIEISLALNKQRKCAQ